VSFVVEEAAVGKVASTGERSQKAKGTCFAEFDYIYRFIAAKIEKRNQQSRAAQKQRKRTGDDDEDDDDAWVDELDEDGQPQANGMLATENNNNNELEGDYEPGFDYGGPDVSE
jgi:hypothetical protein